jgi:hypothetical protein
MANKEKYLVGRTTPPATCTYLDEPVGRLEELVNLMVIL